MTTYIAQCPHCGGTQFYECKAAVIHVTPMQVSRPRDDNDRSELEPMPIAHRQFDGNSVYFKKWIQCGSCHMQYEQQPVIIAVVPRDQLPDAALPEGFGRIMGREYLGDGEEVGDPI